MAGSFDLLVTRVIVGQIAPLILAWMIWRTLLIPHTMAATGLFYIALLGVFVGEILGRQISSVNRLAVLSRRAQTSTMRIWDKS